MPNKEVEISITSNNSNLESYLVEENIFSEIKFVKENKKTAYRVFWIDLSRDLSNISQSLINQYGYCRENDAKLVVIVLHKDVVDVEKNHYFQKMLDGLGKNNPLHRLVFSKDLYQTNSSAPITPFDKYLFESFSSNTINISEKGENQIYPLSIHDFIKALTKTLFLTNTSGHNFWILGDSISDLELSYLAKNSCSSSDQQELDINAVLKNDPKTNSLQSIGNKSRSELNWNPESEINIDLKQISKLYQGSAKEEIKSVKLNALQKLILWVYKPRPKKEKKLPTVKKIIFWVISVIAVTISIIAITCVVTTSLSLKFLETSLRQTLNGNIRQSTKALQTSIKLKEIGESAFSSIAPLANLFSDKETTKISNLYAFIEYSSSSFENLNQTYVMAESILASIGKNEENTNFGDLSLALHSNLSQIYENLNQITLLGNNKLPGILIKRIENNREFQNIQLLEEQVVQFIKISDVIPEIFSDTSLKNILILLQNSQVSKPSGGEVDYLLLLTLDKGNILTKKYFTPQELDSLYQASISAVLKNKRIKSKPSNIQELAQNPNFPESASQISQRVESITKTKPDFVIAVNDSLIRQLLVESNSGAGDKFNQDLSSLNGATEFKEIVDQNLERLFKNEIPLPEIGRTLAKQVSENQILLWSADPNTEKILSSQSFSGLISSHQCNASIGQGNTCISETSYLSENSNNVSRQSVWKDRKVTHKITLSNDVKHEYKIEYQSSVVQSTASAVFVTYDLYISSPSQLDQVLLNDLPSSMKEVKKTQEGLLDRYQISQNLVINQNNVLIFKTSSQTNNQQPIKSYFITEYRQPGMTDSGINLVINYPSNFQPSIVTSQFIAQPEQMSLTLPKHTSNFGFTLEPITQ